MINNGLFPLVSLTHKVRLLSFKMGLMCALHSDKRVGDMVKILYSSTAILQYCTMTNQPRVMASNCHNCFIHVFTVMALERHVFTLCYKRQQCDEVLSVCCFINDRQQLKNWVKSCSCLSLSLFTQLSTHRRGGAGQIPPRPTVTSLNNNNNGGEINM